MHWFVSLFCLFALTTGMIDASEHNVEKLIVSSSKNNSIAQKNLKTLKVYLFKNISTRMLQKKYKLDAKIEYFSNYSAIVISPIRSVSLRNKLLILLSPAFPDIFYISEKETIKNIISPAHNVKYHKKEHIEQDNKYALVDEIGLQWLFIWILSIVGLVLSVRNRRRMTVIGDSQKDMNVYQKDIESEMNSLRGKDA